ncbi:peptide ABC transporter substrate-binding protein SapA [Vibrio sp. NFV-1]|uniref:Peptide ABC transporter substrate-binding protein SapA n=1 Tax=Vibrio nitrifigilis TaxID=2789781 RepID=A0ABS0GEE4_9VIBR|nr:ABC transporter substrate-binding protein SapA [Vibrio nitrifigilis]MBF9000740.1 peptide ABC transporter substrate-binding protein SapA [Vibrio nitrifigilis]
MKALIKLTLSICIIALLAGCDTKNSHSGIRKSGFIYCGQSNLTTFNPQLVDSGVTVDALSPQIYNSLLTLDPETLQPKPSLATSWSVNKDGTEYIFHLRHNVAFQTTDWFTPTRPMDAQDVLFSFRRIIDAINPYHYVNDGIYPWFTGLDFQNLLVDVQELDKYTVKFTLSRPDNSFIANIATPHAVILSAEYAQQLLLKDEKQQIDSLPVGTGPFYLDDYQPHDYVRLKRNPNYWNGVAKMKQVVFDISQRGTGTLAKLLRNECDVLNAPIASQIPTIKKQTDVTLTSKPAMNVAFIAVNTSHPALNDVRVRKAISYAINRQNILDSVFYGTGSIAYNILPPNSWAYQKDSSQIRYDRNYALGLLRAAGYETGLELTMSVPLEPRRYNPSPRKAAELIQSNLADIGIKLTLIPEDRLNRTEIADKENIDLFLTGWEGTTSDPDSFLRPLLSCDAKRAGLNYSMWCNSDFDFLLDLALEVNRPRYRLNLYKQAQNILNQEFPVIPLAHGMQFNAYNKSLTGLHMTPFSVEPFNTVERISN